MTLAQYQVIQIMTRSVEKRFRAERYVELCRPMQRYSPLHASRESREAGMIQNFQPLLLDPREVCHMPGVEAVIPTKIITFLGRTGKVLDPSQNSLFIGPSGIKYLPQFGARLSIQSVKLVYIGVNSGIL
jgi:hypothetical protein